MVAYLRRCRGRSNRWHATLDASTLTPIRRVLNILSSVSESVQTPRGPFMFDMSYGRAVYEHQSAGFQGSTIEEELSPACVAWKRELQLDLESVQTVGEFAVQRIHTQFVNPGLEIDGCLIPLPLVPSFADRIKGVAKPVHFKKDGATVVEYSADLIWELNNSQFRIVNPSWPAFLESIKQDVAHGLGLALSDFDVEPDRLLLYEKGSFIRRHKDSELTPGVSGRLVICLPSEHTGGDVCIEHTEWDHASVTTPGSTFDLSALAWYCGSMHESMEITSGSRLELNYSITQRSGADKSAQFFAKQHARLKERIARWPTELPKLVHFLDHKYSQASLSPSSLKARDRAVVEILSSGCSEAGIYLFFGNITKKEYGDEGEEIYHDYDDVDDDEIEICVDSICTAEGERIASGALLSEQHLLAADPYSNRSADGEEDEGYGGDCPSKLIYHDSVSGYIDALWHYALSMECWVVTNE